MNRRHFIKTALASSIALPMCANEKKQPAFKLSLAEWSLHRMIIKKELSHIDFPTFTKKTFGIDAVEYVNTLFGEKPSQHFLTDLRDRCHNEGVESLLIMVDGEGHIGLETEKSRMVTIERHKKWLDAAQFLGCHSIRVNAHGYGANAEEKGKNCTAGLRTLCEIAEPMGINILVENHGGLSSNAAWLAQVIKNVEMKNCGTLPDFGNFLISRLPKKTYDRYQGVAELMPYAKAVSAKSRHFDPKGNETETDYTRMMQIVLKHGYSGHVGIEYEGKHLSEVDGIRATQRLLQSLL